MRRLARYRFLLLGTVMLLVTSFKLTGDYIINIKTSSSWDDGPGSGSSYIIKGNKTKVTIDYFRVDSLSFLKRMARILSRNSLASEDTTSEDYLRKKDSSAKIFTNRHYHQTLCIYAEQQPNYFKQIDSLLHTPKRVLLRKSSKYSIYYDGATFNFDIAADGASRKFETTNPDKYFAPIVAHFLRNTDAFFYQAKN